MSPRSSEALIDSTRRRSERRRRLPGSPCGRVLRRRKAFRASAKEYALVADWACAIIVPSDGHEVGAVALWRSHVAMRLGVVLVLFIESNTKAAHHCGFLIGQPRIVAGIAIRQRRRTAPAPLLALPSCLRCCLRRGRPPASVLRVRRSRGDATGSTSHTRRCHPWRLCRLPPRTSTSRRCSGRKPYTPPRTD